MDNHAENRITKIPEAWLSMYNFIITTAFAVQHKATLCVGLFAVKMQIADDDVTTVYSNCVLFTQFGGHLPVCLRFAEVNT